MRDAIADVKAYKVDFEASGETMNPFTVMRHCLYKGDKVLFEKMLTDAARERFDMWLSK